MELLGTAVDSDGPIAEVAVLEFTLIAPEPDETTVDDVATSDEEDVETFDDIVPDEETFDDIVPDVEVTEEEVTGDN